MSEHDNGQNSAPSMKWTLHTFRTWRLQIRTKSITCHCLGPKFIDVVLHLSFSWNTLFAMSMFNSWHLCWSKKPLIFLFPTLHVLQLQPMFRNCCQLEHCSQQIWKLYQHEESRGHSPLTRDKMWIFHLQINTWQHNKVTKLLFDNGNCHWYKVINNSTWEFFHPRNYRTLYHKLF